MRTLPDGNLPPVMRSQLNRRLPNSDFLGLRAYGVRACRLVGGYGLGLGIPSEVPLLLWLSKGCATATTILSVGSNFCLLLCPGLNTLFLAESSPMCLMLGGQGHF